MVGVKASTHAVASMSKSDRELRVGFRNPFKRSGGKSQGVVMAAVGEFFLTEAIGAARQVQKNMDVEIDITTDPCGFDYLSSLSNLPFSRIIKLSEAFGHKINSASNRFTKMHSILSSRFDKTIFIDSDVFLLSPIYDVFDTLDYWDFLACHAPVRFGRLHESFTSTFTGRNCRFLEIEEKLRYTVPEVNSGFIALAKSRKARLVISAWEKLYAEQYDYYSSQKSETPRHTDQATLRRSILKHRPKFYILPPEFNVRIIMPYFVGGRAQARVLHGRGPALDKALSVINSRSTVRIGSPEVGLLQPS